MMSESALGIIRVLAGLVVLLVAQPILSKLKSPLWGAIIPALILGMGIFVFAVAKVPVTLGSVVVVVVPLLWTLLDWRRGRQIYRARQAATQEKN